MTKATKSLPSPKEIETMDPKEAAQVKKARKEATESEGIQICVDVINECRKMPGVAGVHIMAIEWEEAVDEIVKKSKIGPKYDPARQNA